MRLIRSAPSGRLARVIARSFPVLALILPIAAPLPWIVPDAAAQLRRLPDNAERGTVQHVREMLVSVDGTERLLAPGAVIRDRLNLIIVPMALPAGGALADYVIDARGQVERIWLLTPEEAATPRTRGPRQP